VEYRAAGEVEPRIDAQMEPRMLNRECQKRLERFCGNYTWIGIGVQRWRIIANDFFSERTRVVKASGLSVYATWRSSLYGAYFHVRLRHCCLEALSWSRGYIQMVVREACSHTPASSPSLGSHSSPLCRFAQLIHHHSPLTSSSVPRELSKTSISKNLYYLQDNPPLAGEDSYLGKS
jgi:hypothetical protein